MDIMTHAYAKLNISLDVLSKMDNGYHDLKMVFQSVSLCDDIQIQCTKGSGIEITTNLKFLPRDGRNIAAKAATCFFEYTGINGYHVTIDIYKRIPVCAGLGGGSSDGAAVLRGLNRLFETKLDQKTLEKLGESLGSDVPYCVAGGTVLAQGRGEILKEIDPMPRCHVVICKPSFSISTPELFGKIECEKIKCHPDTEGIVLSLSQNDLTGVARRMYNVFESVLPAGAGAVAELKSTLLDYKALGAVMTGTGSAVFGLFDDEKKAIAAFEALNQTYCDCFLTETIEKLEI